MLVSEVIAEVRRVVKERPEVCYEPNNGCKYADGVCSDDTIGCLFGQVFNNLGENPKRFDTYPMGIDNKTYTPSVGKILEKEFIGTVIEINWCEKVQEAQDNGLSWKDSILEADKYYLGVE